MGYFSFFYMMPCTHVANLAIVYIQYGVSAGDLIAVGDICYLHFCGSGHPAIRGGIPYVW